MKPQFLIERQGKTFALYAGLLDEAHNIGIESILTNLIQIPDESNGNVAICSCTVSMVGGRQFSGIGDAAPNNVTKLMQNCLIRMAETRAKARALRDAINVGVAALEELAEDEPERQAQAPKANGTTAQKPATNGNGNGHADASLTELQDAFQKLWTEATEKWQLLPKNLPTIPGDKKNDLVTMRAKGRELADIVMKARREANGAKA